MTGTSSGRNPSPTKTIVVYRNGDAFYPGRKVVVSQRQASTFDGFLTSLTRGVEAPFGAVRNVYTPREGHKVSSLDSLQHGERYVAAGTERFKRLDYWQITTKKPQKKKNEPIRPVIHSRILVPARCKRIINESCTINVFTNGDIMVPPARILIPKYTLTSWENVLAMVTEKVHLRTGAVYRLYTLDGYALRGSAELKNNQYYVAVGAAKFRALPYNQWVPCEGIIRENNRVQWYETEKHRGKTEGIGRGSLPPIRKTRHVNGDVCAPTDMREDLEHTARGQMKNHTDSAKPERDKQQKQVSRIPLLVSAGAKSKRKEVIEAAEVPEDPQLKVDLPIDQVEAKVVEEEPEHVYSRSPSTYGVFLHGSDGCWQQRPQSGRSRRDVLQGNSSNIREECVQRCRRLSLDLQRRTSNPSSGQGESGRGTRLTTSPRDGGQKSPEYQERKKEEASSVLCGMRSQMSRFFKEKRKK